jgi:hypothetical protein
MNSNKNSNQPEGYFHYLVGSLMKGSANKHVAAALSRAIKLSQEARGKEKDSLTDNQVVMRINHWYFRLAEDLSIIVELRDGTQRKFQFSPNDAAWWRKQLGGI